jgi:monovalent cation:H+ antiporter-2, CPA2 family
LKYPSSGVYQVEALAVVLKVLTLCVITVSILRSFHLPPILGYILAGVLIGPSCFGWLQNGRELSFIAEFGVVFLLFTIGLELSLPKLISMRRALLGLGGLQVLFCSMLAIGIGYSIGLSLPAAITIAGALALSSTAVVSKLLIEQGELHSNHGRLSFSILLFQDLAAVPFLILIPALGNEGTVIGSLLLFSLLKGALVFVVMLLAGRWLLRPLFHYIAAARSSELFMLTALFVVLLSAFITEKLELSMALGAFLAGVMLAETEYQHQIESDIEPFRDILLGLFFIKIGMLINPLILMQHWFWILFIVVGILIGKTFIITILARFSGYPLQTALRSGLILAQGGEFGFAFLTLAFHKHILNNDSNQIIIASIILSVIISPLIIRHNDKLAMFLSGRKKNTHNPIIPSSPVLVSDELKNHVIICGYGRVGQALAHFLEKAGISFIGLDLDPLRLKEASAANEPVLYGDSTELDTLEAVGIDKATLLILSFDDPPKAKKTLELIRHKHYNIPVLVRTRDDTYLDILQKAGATEVVPETLEATLMLASHMLLLLGISPTKVRQQIEEVKHSRYQILRAFFQGTDDSFHVEQHDSTREALHAVRITESAWAIDKSIEELFEAGLSIKISSFTRDGFKSSRPLPDTLFRNGDIIILQGNQEELYLAEEKLLQG